MTNDTHEAVEAVALAKKLITRAFGEYSCMIKAKLTEAEVAEFERNFAVDARKFLATDFSQSPASPDVRGSVVAGLKPWYRADVFSGLKTEYEIRQQITDGVPDVVSATYEVIAHCRTRKSAEEICHAHNMVSPPAGAEREAVIEGCVAIVQAEVNYWGECVDKAGDHPSADSCFHRYKTALHILEKIAAIKSPSTVPAQDDVVKFIATGEKLFAFLDAFDDGQEECETIKIETTLGAVNSWCGFIEEALRRSRPSPAQTIPQVIIDGLKSTKKIALAFVPDRITWVDWEAAWERHDAAMEYLEKLTLETKSIDLILYCPKCGYQHIDAPDERTPAWKNPPHKSHLCHNCGCVWRPADCPTNGIAQIETHGKADTFKAGEFPFASISTEVEKLEAATCKAPSPAQKDDALLEALKDLVDAISLSDFGHENFILESIWRARKIIKAATERAQDKGNR